jgi:hypothetical protein
MVIRGLEFDVCAIAQNMPFAWLAHFDWLVGATQVPH